MPKRLFDVALTVLTAPLWVPITGVAALVLAFELRGNPVFLQTRVGRHGRPFTMYKLRTMRHAAPGEEDRYDVQSFDTFVFSPEGQRHPRVTKFGAFARKTSLDELPNLVNVLKGEMSIVGPRPEIPEIVKQYPEAYHRRHSVLPGIAGLAQASGRSNLTYDETISYDLDYVDNHSVRRDVEILMKTARAVLTGAGAR